MSKVSQVQYINQVYNEDARKLGAILPDKELISTTISSPPYFDMKDYGSQNQIGFGQSYEEYLTDLQSIFGNIFHITKEDGTLWIIIDTFKRENQVVTLPFDLSNKLKEVGWLLQDVIIWKKDKTVPWSNNAFMQRKFEYILFFSKTSKFKSYKDRVRVYDTDHLKRWWVKYPERYNPKGKSLDEVWEFPIPTQGSWGDKYIRHFCPLPKDMVATMIQLSTDENDIILDPFAGSGSVLIQSAYMKRKYIGFELNNDYIQMFEEYLKTTLKKNREEYELSCKPHSQSEFEQRIFELRALKYGKIVLSQVQKTIGNKNFKLFVEIDGRSNQRHKLIKVNYEFVGEIDSALIQDLIQTITTTKPLSKFGIEPNFKFCDEKQFDISRHFAYSESNTHSYLKDADIKPNKIRIISDISVDLNESDYL